MNVDLDCLRPVIDAIADRVVERVKAELGSTEPDRLALSAAEVAKSLGVSVATVHTLTKAEGGIPSVTIGERIIRYRLEDVRGWIERQQRDPIVIKLSRGRAREAIA
jgi:excisionase family DNA binding protein